MFGEVDNEVVEVLGCLVEEIGAGWVWVRVVVVSLGDVVQMGR